MADLDIIVSLHLVIPFISMLATGTTEACLAIDRAVRLIGVTIGMA
jgi:hypothetical protein